jgi:hypothetical protein
MLKGTRAYRRAGCTPVIVIVAMLWAFTFAVSRVHMMYQAYTDMHEVRDDESWLLGQCAKHEFYSRMKQHSTLCDEVTHNAKDLIILRAIRHVIDNSYLCGYEPCSAIVDNFIVWALGRGLVLTVGLVLLLVFGPVCLVPAYRRQMNMLADERVKELYYTPYDRSHFLSDTAHQQTCIL